MKSLKKTLVLLVVFSMILSAVMPAFAATDVAGLDCEEEVARLEALKVVSGYEDGTYGPEKTITRAEMAVILCKMVGIDTVTVDENKSVPSKFSDVAAGEWYTGYINVAAGKGLLSGFPDGTFRPNETLTMNQVLTLCVNALGRGEYVSEMGTWPANYIAEATKLGLLDDVKTSDANRGNVAIIVWNTLEAPYVWDVKTTEYEGTINLADSERSLLSIYFRDFSFEDASKDRVLKEAEYMTVEAVPSTDGELGKYQIRLVAEDADEDYSALLKSIKDTKKPRGTDDEEWTTTDDGAITAYAPTFENLDSYYGKVVTVIFGKDNEVVSIRIVDDTVDNEYLTAFEKDKLTIGDKTYKFDDEAKVYVNTKEITNYEVKENKIDADEAMEIIAGVLNIDFSKDYNKVIKANVTLNSKDKVTRLDLFVSGNYEKFLTKEAVVSKVRNEVITLTNKEEIDYSEDGEYEDEDDQPRVIKDNKIITLEDIEAGDVLTYYYKSETVDTIKTIYVSSAKKEGELTRTSNTDLKMTVDGEKYYSSMGDVTKSFLFTDDKLSDAKDAKNADDQIGENVTLYLNVYGEYVLMASEKTSENWVFGIVTKIYEEEDDEEDVHTFYKKARVLLADGTTTKNYKFIYDDEDKDFTSSDWKRIDELENKFIVFSPDANGEIELDEYEKITVEGTETTAEEIADGDYEIVKVTADTEVDDDRQRINGKIFSDSTIVFTLKDSDGEYDADVSKDWEILVKNGRLSEKVLNQDTVLVYEEDSKTLTCVLVEKSDYATSDSEYAVVAEEDYKKSNGSSTKKYVDLLLAGATEAETFEAKNLNDKYADGMKEMFVEYKLSGSKLESAGLLIDLPAFKKLKSKDTVDGEVAETNGTKLMVKLVSAVYKKSDSTVKGNLKVIADTEPNKAGSDEILFSTVNDITSGFEVGQYVKHVDAVAEKKAYYRAAEEKDGNNYLLVVADGTSIDERFQITTSNAVKENGTDKWDVDSKVVLVKAVEAAAEKYISADKDTEGALLIVADTVDTVAGDNEIRKADTGLDSISVNDYVVLDNEGSVTVKANFKVVDTQKLLLEYADNDDDDDITATFSEVEVDEDAVVYDARNGEIKELTFSELRTEVEEEGELYVIPFANSDAESDTANILVIVD